MQKRGFFSAFFAKDREFEKATERNKNAHYAFHRCHSADLSIWDYQFIIIKYMLQRKIKFPFFFFKFQVVSKYVN